MDIGYKKKSNPNPRTTAGILSLISYGWVLDLFKKGYKKELEIEDIYDTLDEQRSDLLGDKLENLWNTELKNANDNGGRPSLCKAMFKCFWVNAMVLMGALTAMEFCIVIPQPLFLGGVLRYFEPGSDVSLEMACVFAVCLVVWATVRMFGWHLNCLGLLHTGMKIRVALCSLIYRKALKLSLKALKETTVGQVVNLMSNDVRRFDRALMELPFLWITPVQTIMNIILLWQLIGISTLAGLGTIALVFPLQAYCGKRISTLRMRTAKRTDERIKIMNEIIVGIQVIKMYAWEKPFTHLVSLARKREVKAIRTSAFLQGFLFSLGWVIGSKIAIFSSLVTHALLGNKITAEKIFVSAALFVNLADTLFDGLSSAVAYSAEAYVSIKRLQKFLLHDEMESNNENEVTDIKDNKMSNGNVANGFLKENSALQVMASHFPMIDDEVGVKTGGDFSTLKITNASAKWSEDLPENTLTNINLNLKPGTLLAIIGPVGSGKSSFLQAILKELPLNAGYISVEGSISYASQEPWLFSGPVRQNILFGQPMDKVRYRKVVKVCCLERDFQLFPHGDRTIVGERGITLSGGQKARINLARAIYKQADLYLLDDPLSAVDTHVGRHLFEDCICDFLRDKTRILVTHQLQYLQTADNIMILNNGTVEAQGTYAQLHDSGVDFAKQLALESDNEDNEEEGEGDTASAHSSKTSRQISVTSAEAETEPEVVQELRSRGVVSASVYRAYCAAGGNCCYTLLVFSVCAMSQVFMTLADYWVSYWSKVEGKRESVSEIDDTYKENATFPVTNATFMTTDYSNSSNSAAINTTKMELEWLPSTETCIIVYSCLALAVIVSLIGTIVLFFTMCMKASVNLHNAMFASITRTTMYFFNSNPSGQILNRFSKDMGSVDENLPQTLLDCILIAATVLGVVVIVSTVNSWLLFPTAVMFVLFYLLRQFSVVTSRSVKRLEGIVRSPVFSHLSASLQGLTTIRAYNAQSLLRKEFDNHQDLHSSAWYMHLIINRAFGLWLDSLCLMYLAIVTFSFFLVTREQYSGDVGLAITQSMLLLGSIQWGIRQSAELENNMTSLERVLEYTNVESEPPLESPSGKKPRESWPSQGVVLFDRVFFSYAKDDPPVLKNVNFSVKSCEKIGIVGRTGAGKSSLIQALFRLVDVSSGSVKIDDVDCALLGLHDLRTKISIIPQEPALFSGTVRYNLDPFDQYSDSALWAALYEVELKQVVNELPAGLSHVVSEGGSNFSVGQRQLLCLARAILRNNKILVMDEATANVDPQTDELIQATIRRKFANCTVLTIAHRLHTVMDSDRVIVMDAGHVMEFDHPHILLKNKSGIFHQMVEQTGHSMAESLFRIAQTCYERRLENFKEKIS